MSDIEIEIDGKKILAKPGSMVIQVADAENIYIPRFCYHKLLTVAANCRMCLVEVEKSPKPLPACATPVMPGMKIMTRSPKALAAQKAVMEFLLINHPLDCPICDQGGECELQDLSLGFGAAESFYNEGKRTVKDKDIGPLVATDMTRCIQCTRCVRFGDEIAGLRELGATGRGEHMEIGTYVEHTMQSEVSGNIIDLCPVGALTSKPFRFTARAWELTQFPSIAPHDCIGSNIYIHTRQGKVMRAVPRENLQINEIWISDRDRFSYEGLYHDHRLAKPKIRLNGQWQETDWQTALTFAAEGLQAVIQQHSGEQIGGLVSPSATLEELYLFQKFMRGMGSPHIDHRLRQVDFSDQDEMPVCPGLGMHVNELEECDTIFLIGSNIQREQPSAALRIRKAFLQGAKIAALNMVDYNFHFNLSAKQIVSPANMVLALAKVLKKLDPQAPGLETVQVDEAAEKIAQQLCAGQRSCILLGNLAFQHPQAALLRSLAQRIAELTVARLGMLTEGANTGGAWLTGNVPHRMAAAVPVDLGLNAQAMLNEPRKAYVLLNVEPDLDCANPVAAQQALKKAEFVVALSLFANPVLEQHANVIFPMAAFTETAGTFVNAAGEIQSFQGVATPFEESRPAWKILRVLGNLLQLNDFDYQSIEDVRHEINIFLDKIDLQLTTNFKLPRKYLTLLTESTDLVRMGEVPLYASDSLVRHAAPLQKSQILMEGDLATVRLHPETAKRLQLQENSMVLVKQTQGEAQLPVRLDERIPLEVAAIASGLHATASLSELFGAIKII